MRTVITALQLNVETSVYNDDNKLAGRPRTQPIVFFEAEIPPEWLAVIQAKLQKGEG